MVQCFCPLLIVPFWNWNPYRVVCNPSELNLLIVPFWNWNPWKVLWPVSPHNLLIVPFWNWNARGSVAGMGTTVTFNRTILELKPKTMIKMQQAGLLLIVPFWNWNTWIMFRRHNSGLLLIVPFWNWNTCGQSYPAPCCKLLIVPFWNWNNNFGRWKGKLEFTFNRTILELKHQKVKNYISAQIAFNRTILELKHRWCCCRRFTWRSF